jgi:CheY-like chemotaxis protein
MAKGRLKTKILIVDDEETIGFALSEILKDEGFETTYVVDGSSAVEEVKRNGYNLVLMDMVMPGMNGLETYRAIKKVRRSAKVVLFTGYIKDADDIISQGVKEGMIDEQIRKPYLADEIIRTARKHSL